MISVGDCDTLRVLDAGRKARIRVACIDAPEVAQAPYGLRARQALQELLPVGSTVSLKVQSTDRYGRTLAEVFSDNGRIVGLTLLELGNSYAYRQYMRQCYQWAYLDREKLAERSQTIGRTALSGGPQPSTNCSLLATAAQRCLASAHQGRHILRTLNGRTLAKR